MKDIRAVLAEAQLAACGLASAHELRITPELKDAPLAPEPGVRGVLIGTGAGV